MESLDIYILTTVVATLFLTLIIGTYRELSKIDTGEYKPPSPDEKKYGRQALFVLAEKLFEDQKIPKKDKKAINKAVNRTIADMESDGLYFPEQVKKELVKQREELNCEYSGLPSPKYYQSKK